MDQDCYQSLPNQPELRLEDFMGEDETVSTASGKISQEQGQRFSKIVEDVHHVLALGKDGKTISEIASELKLDPQYVYDIQVSAQGFREDDEIAVAHLMEMSF